MNPGSSHKSISPFPLQPFPGRNRASLAVGSAALLVAGGVLAQSPANALKPAGVVSEFVPRVLVRRTERARDDAREIRP